MAAMNHHDQRPNWGGKGFFGVTLPDHSSSSEEVRAGNQTELEPRGKS